MPTAAVAHSRGALTCAAVRKSILTTPSDTFVVDSSPSGTACSRAEPCPDDQTNGEEQASVDVRRGADNCSVQCAETRELSGSSFDLVFSRGVHPDPARNVVLRIEAETEPETRVRPRVHQWNMS